jgi:hypothetical protein
MNRIETLTNMMEKLMAKATPLNRNILDIIWNTKKPVEEVSKSSPWTARIIFSIQILLFFGACYVEPTHRGFMFVVVLTVILFDLSIPLAFLIRTITIKLQKKDHLTKDEAIDLYGRIGIFSLLSEDYKEDPILQIITYARILLFLSQLWIFCGLAVLFHVIAIKFIAGPVMINYIEKMVEVDFTKD